jgi:hypothetical protein
MVEEGAPFCPQCRAPQIRVNIPSPEQADQNAPATPPFPPGTPGELQPPAQPVPLHTRVRLRDALGSALAASVLVVAGVMFLPAALLLIVIAGGAFAVVLYIRRRPEARLSAGGGARIGALNGLLTAIVVVLISLAGFLADGGATIKATMVQRIHQMQASNPEAAQTLLKDINQPDFFAAMVVAVLLAVALVIIVLSSVGGAVAARLQPKNRR